MKRANPQGSGDGSSSSQIEGKRKMVAVADEQDAGDDELLAALGYKVRSSDMAEVAQKLEQLEMAMGGGSLTSDIVPTHHDDDVLSHLSSDTVHYNPSDLSNWLENMLSEFNPPPPSPYSLRRLAPADSSTITTSDDPTREKKRIKSTASSSDPTSHLPVVMVDSQETGIRLVHALLACAEAVQRENLKSAESLVKEIGVLAMSQGGSMRKVATYFAEALARRIYRIYPSPDPTTIDSAFSDVLQSHFYDSAPYLKFAHFTANQAILDAFNGRSRVHVIDFSMKQGLQWPPLMQALALRPGGPPFFRLTGIGPPQPDNSDALQQVGWKLARLAKTIHVEFEYRGFVANTLADVESCMLDLRTSKPETVAVNSVLDLHRLLNRTGAVEKVLNTVKSLNPSVFTVAEVEANHNGPVFLDRFTEALHYYSSMFDSLETAAGGEDGVMTEVYLGRQICNVVGCEGKERVERHETAEQWRRRMEASGFEAKHLGSNAYKQASMLLELFAGGEGYRIEEKDGCLMLGWHTRPLITSSAWRIAPPPPSGFA